MGTGTNIPGRTRLDTNNALGANSNLCLTAKKLCVRPRKFVSDRETLCPTNTTNPPSRRVNSTPDAFLHLLSPSAPLIMTARNTISTGLGRTTKAPASYNEFPLPAIVRQLGFSNLLDATLAWARHLDQPGEDAASIAAEMNHFAESHALDELHHLFLEASKGKEDEIVRGCISSKFEDMIAMEWSSVCEMSELKQKTNLDVTTDGLERFDIQKLYQTMRSRAPTLVPLVERLCCNPRIYDREQSPDADTIKAVVLTLAQLAQVRNPKNNFIQTIISMYMYGSKVPKRVMNMLAKTGIATSHQTTLNTVKDASSKARENMKALVASRKAFQVSFDNVNFLRNVRDQRILNQKSMANLTAGFVVFLPDSLAPKMFTKTDLLLSEVPQLRPEDFFPTEDEDMALLLCFRALIWDVLCQFCEKRGLTGKLEKGYYTLPQMYQLNPKEKHRVHTLPIYEKNEGVVRDMIDILQSISDDLDLKSEQVLTGLILFKGDFLTVRNIRLRTLYHLANVSIG